MTATKKQIQIIAMNLKDKETREEVVFSATKDPERTSTKSLTFDEANEILQGLGYHKFKPVKKFDSKNPKHRVIMNLCHELEWVFYDKGRQLADLDKLGEWLMTNKRSPVQKRTLCEMTPQEAGKSNQSINKYHKMDMGKEVKQREKSQEERGKNQGCRVKQQAPDLDKELEKIAKAMLEDWRPEVQVDSFIGTHGSHKGEVIEHTSYYNELTGLYTDKEEAFAGYVVKKIKGMLNK